MKNSIYLRNFLATALIVLISFAMLGGLSTVWSYRQTMTAKSSAMLSTMRETYNYISAQRMFLGMGSIDLNLSMWLAMLSGISGFDLLVSDVSGVVWACSDKDFKHLGKTIPQSGLAAASSDENSVVLTNLGGIFPELRQVAGMPLTMTADGTTYAYGYLFVSSDLASFRREWQQFTGAFTMIALVVMALAFVISFLATKKQAEPLNEIAGAALRFARGDFSVRVGDTERYDEIGQLAKAFNAMADSLESSEKHRRDFIANLSHELKTPMTVIDGFAEGLIDGTIPQEKAAKYLGVISSETRRLSRLVGSMLNVSKLQSVETSALLSGSFEISEVIRLSLLSFEGKIENKALDIDAKLPESPMFVRGDKDAITQVVYNIIDNAIKFSPKNGLISVELWKQGNKGYVSVENSGETIPSEEMQHIFDRFHKIDKSRSADREGVGLGLYIVKTILDNHREDVFLTSANGKTKFVFTLTVRE